jgi:hypothetical protein
MFGALGSPPSYTALGWQDQKTKNYIGFFLWGNYKTLRKTESKTKREHTEVAEDTEARGTGGPASSQLQFGKIAVARE